MKRTIVLLLLLLAPGGLAAQQEIRDRVGTLPRDTRIRVHAPGAPGDGARGYLVSAGPDTVVLTRNNGVRVAVPWRTVRAVDLSAGRNRFLGAIAGLGLGTLAGAGAGYLLGYGGGPQGENSFYFGIVGAAVGAPLGLVVGAVTGVEEWEPFAGAPRVSIAPAPGRGVGVAVSRPVR